MSLSNFSTRYVPVPNMVMVRPGVEVLKLVVDVIKVCVCVCVCVGEQVFYVPASMYM